MASAWEDSGMFIRASTEENQLLLKYFTKFATNKSVKSHLPFRSADSLAKDSIRQDFCREALAWRSLLHRFILPLLGIYEEESRLFLVSPFMSNGTLTDWRKNEQPSVVEINRVVRFLHLLEP